jgi:hypothetical protein
LNDETNQNHGENEDEDPQEESSKNKNKNHENIFINENESEHAYIGGEEEEMDANQLMVKALQEMMKELRRKPKTKTELKRESRLVDFPTFSAGDQDPITWLDAFKQACIANNVAEDRRLAIATSYLKGTALTWYKTSNILHWDDFIDPERSFIHQFKKQYCNNFRKAQWKQKLRNHKQQPGETIESYSAKLYELWHRIDPEGHRDESDRIQEFMEGLRPEFILHVQASMPDTVEKAVDKAKSVEIGLSMNMGLSDYSLNDNYLRKTKGENIPLQHALAINDEPNIE